MTANKIRALIQQGEKLDVELKLSAKGINKDVYDTVCSFNNRVGGHIILGVEDKTREICGIEAEDLDKMIKEFTTAINNPVKINPPIYLTPEIYDIDGKKILYIRVPEGTQLRRHNGRIYDRTYEGDINITNDAESVYKMYARKQGTFFVNKVYPHLGLDFLNMELVKKAKKMAVTRTDNHPWTSMTEEELLRSTGLILVDAESGKEGITLAAILLFGKDTTIMSVLPQYKTDAIYRVKNMDRYDDRDVVITNLLDSYERLVAFGKKHLNDTFVLDGVQSVSARDRILREIVSNTLAHRDYSNAFPAKFIIDAERIYTENSNLPHGHGELHLNKFEPFPKNPPISKLFREIGYADELGSGMRNTNKYTKLYSGGTPIFEEGDIFKITIPIENVVDVQIGPDYSPNLLREERYHYGVSDFTEKITKKIPINTTKKTTKKNASKTTKKTVDRIMDAMERQPSSSAREIAHKVGITTDGVQYHIRNLKKRGMIERIGPDKGGYWKVNR